MSEKKCVALGVTGCIAAYKAADLCSKMAQKELDVHVLMTSSALELVTARTFFTLSRNPVISSLWDIPDWQPGHVALADHAELLVVAPCTANFIGKFAHGIADDALTTYALAHSGKILLAPAMNPKMWANPAVQDNIKLLKSRGVEFIGPEAGHVACGEGGVGRMSDPTDILSRALELI
jgi:phosphopantothenoylcysteine synthetase/decarboxylase